ncbi:MAG TPA: aminotransferase class I/II-fold pyridoxal phosphate-dependent enzyme [Thermoanaerobaculaceae bacterium]|nr:aminotransferase class I/II-fold pyridoxal phosphate-dependent enzyme [Thermoanaerobaculaceae bacterium]HRS17500.1 aminotransferase class I/II-fold pyridoxal phosphate-dependent enzyme [Thermoanaerobaculaceae bacterium]
MGHHLKPQTVIFEKGYDPHLSEGAAVPPVFRTSTFVFRTAEEGKRAFEIAYGLRPAEPGESPALIYTRVNNPNAEMVEDKVVAWDGTEAAALFSSGMGAISNSCLAFLRPGDTVVFSDPVYGGTEYFFRHLLPAFHIRTIPFPVATPEAELDELVRRDPTIRIIFLESPANPTMMLADIPAARRVADRHSTADRRILVFVDNTFMGPIFSRPREFGADVILYSGTKFIGGHSDVVAGLALGSKALIGTIKVMRTILGANAAPDTAWLILRSLSTLHIRMEKQQENARKVVDFLHTHPKVVRVAYPGDPSMGDEQVERWRRQLSGTGSVLSFFVDGGEKEAFAVLDRVRLMKLAVSLGGVESLIEHPHTMTHADMTEEEKARAGITPSMIRLSVGLEDPDDLVADLRQALDVLG